MLKKMTTSETRDIQGFVSELVAFAMTQDPSISQHTIGYLPEQSTTHIRYTKDGVAHNIELVVRELSLSDMIPNTEWLHR